MHATREDESFQPGIKGSSVFQWWIVHLKAIQISDDFQIFSTMSDWLDFPLKYSCKLCFNLHMLDISQKMLSQNEAAAPSLMCERDDRPGLCCKG